MWKFELGHTGMEEYIPKCLGKRSCDPLATEPLLLPFSSISFSLKKGDGCAKIKSRGLCPQI